MFVKEEKNHRYLAITKRGSLKRLFSFQKKILSCTLLKTNLLLD